ncbi:EamA family transporter [Nostoc ellipsosporum NOK]|nr:EamA family transporter [Nostoc ellipsosporum NOK]
MRAEMKKAFLQLHIAVFLAGFTGLLGKLITLNEGLLVWYRLLITAATMWLLWGYQKKIVPLPAKDKLRITGIGFIAALHWVSFYGAIKYGNISIALICLSAMSFFSAILEPLLTRQRFKPLEILLGLMAIAGIYIIFHFDARFKMGIIIGLISAFLAALFPIFLRREVQRINVETVLTWQMTGGWLTLSLVMPFYLYYFPTDQLFPDLSNWLWLLVLAWLCTVLAMQLSANALQKLSAFTVNLSYNLEPVYGVTLAFLVAGENEDVSQWFYLGFAVIIFAVVVHTSLLRVASRRQLAEQPPA